MNDLVDDILQHQRHRGPDCTAKEYFDLDGRRLILGHNRLSIIDLSDHANQPFYDILGQYCVVFNGEIYNYLELRASLAALGEKFITESDTEVLVRAIRVWGLKALEKFNGMFAFALFDIKTKELLLVRDRYGVKPLYYFFDRTNFFFASAPSVIGRFVKSAPDLRYLSRGLRKWFFESNDSISPFEKISSLKPGNYLKVSLKEPGLAIEERPYYHLKERVLETKEKLKGRSYKQTEAQFADIFSDAVRLRLRSDVPVGVSLSGGIDSSTVAAFASELNPDLIGINYGRADLIETEGPVVQRLAKQFGIRPEFVWASREELQRAFWNVVEAQDSPIHGLSYIAEYMVYQKARECGIKVMLGGQGGDESFMGYRKYLFYYYQHQLRRSQYLKSLKTLGWIASNVYHQMGHFKDYGLAIRRYINPAGITPNLNLPEYDFDLRLGNNQEIWERQITDLMVTSLPTQLKSEDRNSMRNSIETRLPFLDYRVVEFGMAIEPEFKIHRGFSKWLIRAIAKGKVPDEVRLARFKRSFDIRQEIIGEEMIRKIKEIVLDNYQKVEPFLKSQDSLKLYDASTVNSNQLRFQELMTLLWIAKTF